MTQKINRCLVIGVWLLAIGLLVYSRFVNLDWGLPYPMHPDERNMANAIQSLNCEISNFKFQISNCFNPHFFAYGQLPLYLGYFLIWISHEFRNFGKFVITFDEAVISLRTISAIASVINVFVLVKIVELISNVKDQKSNRSSKLKSLGFTLGFALCTLIFALSPFTIQFAHFGTTESLLMLFYSLIVFYSLRIIDDNILNTKYLILSSFFSGLALATKASAALFLVVPMFTLISNVKDQKSNPSSKLKSLGFTLGFALCTLIFAIIFSPHNFIHWKDFLSSMNYEGDVALGRYVVFYTRQFVGSIPILFQFEKIFPYILGLPIFVLSILGFLFLSWKDKKTNILRFAFLIYFLPTAFMFAKWSRFMAPVLPLMLIFTLLTISKIKDQISKIQIKNQKFYILICHFAFCILIFALICPGISYLSVYQKSDVRFQASKWIYENIPNNSTILSETANVVDIPISNETIKQSNIYNIISFDLYNLDGSPSLQTELRSYLATVDYIFVPSRRIFANSPKNKYPQLSDYYEKLFSGKLGFKKVAEFSSGLNDENAEETWTVFDHPVIRIYKRISSKVL